MIKEKNKYLFTSKDLYKLIIPLVLEQLLEVIVGMSDSIMIASVGEEAVSGVSLMDNVYILLINIFAALATGGAVVIGQYMGRKDIKKARESATQLIWLMLFSAIGIMALVYVGKEFILTIVFGDITKEVYNHANTYLMICSASIPFLAVYNGGAAIFRAQMNSKIPMLISCLMNVINVVGNAILIFGFKFGTAGVAIPTLVSRMVAAFVIVYLVTKKSLQIHIDKTLKFKFNKHLIKKILHIGIPSGLENSMFQLGKILVLSLVASFGTSAIAANAVSSNLCNFEILPGIAIGFAMVTVVSRCIGAGEIEQAKFFTKKLMKICYIALWGTNIIIFILLPFILKVYNLTPETSETARNIILYHGVCSMLIWPLAFTISNTFRAAGDAQFPMIVGIISMWTCRIALSYVIGKNLGLGVFGVWVAMTIDWVVRTIFYVYRYLSGKWIKKAI
ncbi:MAG: MATE family efflux transporter [Clostridium sp.]|nr:MATE family efflux transporter [Clostridium sp.]